MTTENPVGKKTSNGVVQLGSGMMSPVLQNISAVYKSNGSTLFKHGLHAVNHPSVSMGHHMLERRGSASAMIGEVGNGVHAGSQEVDSNVKRGLACLGLQHKAFKSAFYLSIPCGVTGLTLSILRSKGYLEYLDEVEMNPVLWNGIIGVLSFIIVFRASQAYGRYWSAQTSVRLMRAEWFDAFSALCSCCAFDGDDEQMLIKVRQFKHLVARLFSLCHLAALLNLVDECEEDETKGMLGQLEIMDPESLDPESMEAFCDDKHSQMRIELVYHWIQHLITRSMHEKVLVAPAPIISRSLHELANGMVKYHDALKIKTIQFPPQYQQVCDVLLTIHWVLSPLVSCLWCNDPTFVFIFSFTTQFFLSSLRMVSTSIENPFRLAQFLEEAQVMQCEFNASLAFLLTPHVEVVPHLLLDIQTLMKPVRSRTITLEDFWEYTQKTEKKQQTSEKPHSSPCAGAFAAILGTNMDDAMSDGGGEGDSSQAPISQSTSSKHPVHNITLKTRTKGVASENLSPPAVERIIGPREDSKGSSSNERSSGLLQSPILSPTLGPAEQVLVANSNQVRPSGIDDREGIGGGASEKKVAESINHNILYFESADNANDGRGTSPRVDPVGSRESTDKLSNRLESL